MRSSPTLWRPPLAQFSTKTRRPLTIFLHLFLPIQTSTKKAHRRQPEPGLLQKHLILRREETGPGRVAMILWRENKYVKEELVRWRRVCAPGVYSSALC